MSYPSSPWLLAPWLPAALPAALLGALLRASPALATPAPAATPATAAEPAVADLAWIAGCWAAEGGEPGSGEQWTAPAGGSMLGTARTVKGGQTVGFEFLRLAAGEGGRLTLFAQPSGAAPAAFPLRELGAQQVIFEDLAHDFPQRVTYRLDGPTRLVASVEGALKGELRRIDFAMHRVSCEPPR